MSEENGYIDADDRIGLPDEMDESRPLITSKGLKAIQELYGDKDLPGRPQPPVPRNLDLRDMPSMLLDVARLRNSAVARTPNAEAFRAAVMLWCASWHEIPASSLPNNDLDLCHLAGFGRDQAAWQAIREQALHGYYECADGRLYHPVVAEKALDAAVKRNSYHDKMEKARAALAAKRSLMGETAKETIKEPIKVPMIEALTGHKETKGKEKEVKSPSLRSGKRPHRLPDDFELTLEHRTFALTLLPENRVQLEFEKFCDYWHSASGRNAVKLDWNGAWRNWCRKAAEYAGNTGGFNGRRNGSAIDAAERIKQRFGGDAAARAYVPGSAGPTLGLDYGTGQENPKRLPKG